MAEDPNGFDLDETEVPPSKSSGNQGFILIVSILGGLFLIALIVMAIFVVVVLPRNRAAQSTQTALIYQGNTATVMALTKAAGVNSPTATPVPATDTLTPTPIITTQATLAFTSTSVLAQANGSPTVNLGSADSRTATVAALLTQAAAANITTTATGGPTSTSLPTTGFASDAGIPSLLGLTVILLVVIFLVRRLRASNPA